MNISFSWQDIQKTALYGVGVLAFAGIGTLLVMASHAATQVADLEAEDGALTSCATSTADASASGGAAVNFGGSCSAGSGAGASLPITYNLASLTGAVRYVAPAPTGNDANAGTQAAPFATLSKAISASASNDNIILRGGTYRGQAGLSIGATKTLKIMAYPGEIPVLNGAQAVTSGWTTEGSFQYIAYTPRPVTDGIMSFTTKQGVAADGVGQFADQAWQGTNNLKEVAAKSSLADGKFFVDRTNNRLYMTAADVAKGAVEVSQVGRLVSIQSPNTRMEGIRIQRYSENGGEYGMILIEPDADRVVIKNVEVLENSYTAFFINGAGAGSNRNDGTTLEHVTIDKTNWLGVSPNATDNFSLLDSKITNMNYRDEFLPDPVSGAIKTARTWYTKVIGNEISNTHGHAVWFDVSNYQATVANNSITATTAEGLFWEISDDLLLINNYIAGTGGSQPVRIAGSSGVKIINNTVIGGKDAIGIYTDDRSIAGCSNPANPPCGPWGSLRDSFHLPIAPTMDWIPRVDLMINNIVAYPTQAGFCGVLTPVCITQHNTTADVPVEWTLHQANYNNTGRPQTLINGNVYANGTGTIIAVNTPLNRFTTTSAFATWASGSPVSISGFEAAGKFGNSFVNPDGSPTSTLSSQHGSAVAVPTNSAINTYVPAGTKHYGVTWK